MNENIVEMSVYVGDTSTITAGLIQTNRGVKMVRITIADIDNPPSSKTLNSQELSLLIEILTNMREKQTNSRNYR